MANYIMFFILAFVILGSAVLCVMTKRIMRAATFLLFVLFGVAILSLIGLATVCVVLLKNKFMYAACQVADVEVPMSDIGHALVGADKYQYVLPFEFISVFLLACIIGGLAIARKDQKLEK